MIRSYRFTVIALAVTIIVLFVVFAYIVTMYIPEVFVASLDIYFSDKEFVQTQ